MTTNGGGAGARYADPSVSLLSHQLRPTIPLLGTSLPSAPASAAAPAGNRRMWAAWARCPFCSGQHLHRGASREALDGAVRAGCGHPYIIDIKRTYRPRVVAS